MKLFKFGKKLLRIIAVIPSRNKLELLCEKTGQIFYFKFPPDQSVQEGVRVGDLFQIRSGRFIVLRNKKQRVPGLSGSLKNEAQKVLLSS